MADLIIIAVLELQVDLVCIEIAKRELAPLSELLRGEAQVIHLELAGPNASHEYLPTELRRLPAHPGTRQSSLRFGS